MFKINPLFNNKVNKIKKIYKIIIVGDSNTGKSLIVSKITSDENNITKPTIGIEITTKEIENENIIFQFWDAASNTKYLTVKKIFYANCDFAILTFSLNIIQSFENLKLWINEMEFFNIFQNIPTNNFQHVNINNKFPKIIFVGTTSSNSISQISNNKIFEMKENFETKYKIKSELFIIQIFEKNANDKYNNIINYFINQINKN